MLQHGFFSTVPLIDLRQIQLVWIQISRNLFLFSSMVLLLFPLPHSFFLIAFYRTWLFRPYFVVIWCQFNLASLHVWIRKPKYIQSIYLLFKLNIAFINLQGFLLKEQEETTALVKLQLKEGKLQYLWETEWNKILVLKNILWFSNPGQKWILWTFFHFFFFCVNFCSFRNDVCQWIVEHIEHFWK